MKKTLQYLLLFVFFIAGYGMTAQTDGLPTNPKPGKCYVKCVTKAEFGTETVRIMTKPSYTTLEVVPATYKTVYDTVLVKEAAKRYEFTPAEYEVVDVPYVSKATSSRLEVVPAVLGDDSEEIKIYPETSGWEYEAYPCPDPRKEDCQTLCWKEYPARYTTVDKKTLTSDASTKEIAIPETNATYQKRVVSKPAAIKEIEIPAEYDVIARQVVDQPATTRKTTVPAEYKEVTKTVLVKAGGLTVWEEVDCELLTPTELSILWDFNSAVLNNAAKREIDRELIALMKDKPAISIELSSHTDSRGNDDYNMALSQRRADAVKSYIVSQGVKGDRIISKGYGESRLKNHCSNGVECSEELHQVNRRTEFIILQN